MPCTEYFNGIFNDFAKESTLVKLQGVMNKKK